MTYETPVRAFVRNLYQGAVFAKDPDGEGPVLAFGREARAQARGRNQPPAA